MCYSVALFLFSDTLLKLNGKWVYIMSNKLKSYTAFCVSILCLIGAVIVQFTLNFNQYLSDTLPITVFGPISLFVGGLLVFSGVLAWVYGSHVLSTLQKSEEPLGQWQNAVLRIREKLVLFRWPAPIVPVVYGFFASSFVVLFTLLVLLTTTVMVPQTTGLLENTDFHGISSYIMTIGLSLMMVNGLILLLTGQNVKKESVETIAIELACILGLGTMVIFSNGILAQLMSGYPDKLLNAFVIGVGMLIAGAEIVKVYKEHGMRKVLPQVLTVVAMVAIVPALFTTWMCQDERFDSIAEGKYKETVKVGEKWYSYRLGLATTEKNTSDVEFVIEAIKGVDNINFLSVMERLLQQSRGDQGKALHAVSVISKKNAAVLLSHYPRIKASLPISNVVSSDAANIGLTIIRLSAIDMNAELLFWEKVASQDYQQAAWIYEKEYLNRNHASSTALIETNQFSNDSESYENAGFENVIAAVYYLKKEGKIQMDFDSIKSDKIKAFMKEGYAQFSFLYDSGEQAYPVREGDRDKIFEIADQLK